MINLTSYYKQPEKIHLTTQEIFNAVLAFDGSKVTAKTQAEIDAGTNIEAILNDGLIGAMDEVGEKFSAGELFIPEMLMAGGAPVTQDFIDKIGADTYGANAAASEKAKALLT